MIDEVCLSPAVDLAAKVRSGAVSARALVEAHLAQIARVNPTVNAVVVPRFEAALREADAADAAVARGDALGPLHGVPCTIKECFAFEAMPQTAGLVARRGYRATGDATAVARLRKAGAIALGLTNTSELCMWVESANHVYGRTTGAYDPARIAGGSSGGEGAAVGAAMSPFGLGSDVGGSIRLPAFFNGVFGHKPSGCMVPSTGQFPAPVGAASRMLATGPLCRSARDLYPLLSLLAGPDGHDPACRPMPLHDPGTVDLRALTVLDLDPETSFGVRVDTALRDAQHRAVASLGARGARVTSLRLTALRDAFEIWSACMHDGNAEAFGALLGAGETVTPARALGRLPAALLGRPPYTLAALGLCVVEALPGLLPRRQAAMRAALRSLRETLARLLEGPTVLVMPTFPQIAPRHHAPLLSIPSIGFTGFVNALELPATSVPMGLDPRGLPTGLQLVAAQGADHLTLAVALALEEAHGGWVAPARWC
ncbi:MAG: amidase [Myxococcales bacterium]|nr:amidase [Myxococcales bacterium]